jgi:hypothetical protein
MPTDALAHFVFVDLENVGTVDLAPIAGAPVNVTLLVGKKQTALPTALVEITQLPFEVRLVKVGATRKNALDFSLVFHLGQMAGRHPDAGFYIVSGDKRDFDMIVTHMRAHQVQVSRVDSIAELPFLPAAAPVGPAKSTPATKAGPATKKTTPEDRLTKLIESFKKGPAGRPKKRDGLRHRISAAYGNKVSDAELTEIVASLEKGGIISIDAKDRVSYAATH